MRLFLPSLADVLRVSATEGFVCWVCVLVCVSAIVDNILGIDKKADKRAIKKAYFKLARVHHPVSACTILWCQRNKTRRSESIAKL